MILVLRANYVWYLRGRMGDVQVTPHFRDCAVCTRSHGKRLGPLESGAAGLFDAISSYFKNDYHRMRIRVKGRRSSFNKISKSHGAVIFDSVMAQRPCTSLSFMIPIADRLHSIEFNILMNRCLNCRPVNPWFSMRCAVGLASKSLGRTAL